MRDFLEVAEESIAILESGFSITKAYPVLRQLEPARTLMLGRSSWPGCLIKCTKDGAYEVATSHPNLDDFCESTFSALTDEENKELTDHFLTVIRAWVREAKRIQKHLLHENIMDCYIELSNILPRDAMIPVDKLNLKTSELLQKLSNAYADLADKGFLAVGGDPFSTRPVQHGGIVTSSYGRLIAELSRRAIEKVLSLALDYEVSYSFERLSTDDLHHLKSIPFTQMAINVSEVISRAELDELMHLHCAEIEIVGNTPEELRLVARTETVNRVDLSKVASQISLTDNQNKLVEAMFNLNATPSNRQTKDAILKEARWDGEGKRALKPLKDKGLIYAQDGQGGGYWLSELGMHYARAMLGAP